MISVVHLHTPLNQYNFIQPHLSPAVASRAVVIWSPQASIWGNTKKPFILAEHILQQGNKGPAEVSLSK